MKKNLILMLLFSTMFSYGQITIYIADNNCSYGVDKDSNKAYSDCVNSGGNNCRNVCTSQYGCWAIVKGSNQNGNCVIGVGYGAKTSDEAVSLAKTYATNRNAVFNTLYVIRSSCENPPVIQQQGSQQQSQYIPEWSEWRALTGTDCNTNIEIQTSDSGNGYGGRTKHYRVRNNNDKSVTFTLVLDASDGGKFTKEHNLNPGERQEFFHRMKHNVTIKGYKLENLVFTTSGKPVCRAAGEDELQSLKKRREELCQELSGVLGGYRQSIVFDEICKNLYNKSYVENDVNKLKNEVSKLEQELRLQKSSKPKGETLQDLQGQRNELCQELNSLVVKSGMSNQVNENLCLSGVHLPSSLQQDINALKTEIAKLKNLNQEVEKQKEEQLRKQQEEQRRAEEQQNRFNGYITQGDNAYSSRNYDNAMSYYSQAKNIAANESQKQIADQKYNHAFEAKRTAERQERIEAQNIRDKNEDLAYTSLATGAVGVMSLINDQYAHEGSSAKFQMGVGYEQTPMITNQTNPYAAAASYADKASYPLIHLGLNLEFLNKKAINFNVRPIASIGIDAFSTGTSGTYVVTGVESGLRFWYKSHAKFKLFADIGWYERIGDKTADKDAQSGGTTATDEVKEGKYSYHVLRYGGGPMLHLRHDGRETWIKPGVYFEKLTFAKYDKPTMSFILSANIESEIILEAAYSKNYPVAGTINYPNAFTYANQNYFSIKIIRQGKIW